MRNLDAQAKADIEAAEARVQKFLRQFDSFLRDSLYKTLSGLHDKSITAQETVVTLNKLRAELERAGLGEKLAEVEKIYARELTAINKQFEALGYKNAFSDVDAKYAETLMTYDVDGIKSKVFASTDALKSAVMRNVLAGQKPDIYEIAGSEADTLTNDLERDIRTGVSGFNQAVTNNKAKELGLTLFVYLGPDDDITRPFCEALIEEGRVYTDEDIAAMDNGQGLPVAIYGGGYNCRHQWRPITEELAKDDYGYEA